MGANNNRLSPRQKMINLMYIVLTAMLALNVSSDVLDGFVQVHEGLRRSNENVAQRNAAIYSELEEAARQNPEKAAAWLEKATAVREATDNLNKYIEQLTLDIVRQADGPKGDPTNIQNRDDLEAAAVVMLAPGNRRGEELRKRVDEYREAILAQIEDPAKAEIIRSALSTDPIQRAGQVTPQQWEEAKFDQQPVVAAVTLMSKLQNDILYAEGEVLANLLSRVDAGDVRVNELNAFVIPQSRLVMRGGQYQASIVLAAIDTTMRPEIFVGGQRIANGKYSAAAGSTGTFTYKGYINMPHPDGTSTRHEFSSEYTVIEPMATVSATMMNVFYAGIDNPVSISVPGVPMNSISATMTGGSLTRQGDHWVARPTPSAKEAVLTVTANIDGRTSTVANSTFRIRQLPDPTAYIAYAENGTPQRYKGNGKRIAKAQLLASSGLGAAIDDGLLDVNFTVESFKIVVFGQTGEAMTRASNGAAFSREQIEYIRNLKTGKPFFITDIKAKGPDGSVRSLSPIQVII